MLIRDQFSRLCRGVASSAHWRRVDLMQPAEVNAEGGQIPAYHE
jgi:hypothetical protein